MEKKPPVFRPYTKRSEYAIRALIKLVGTRQKTSVAVRELLKHADIPEHFTRKVLRSLVKKRLLEAVTGPFGGYRLRRDPGEVTLQEIIEAAEGKKASLRNECILGQPECTDETGCFLHGAWMRAREGMHTELKSTTLKDMMREEAHRKPGRRAPKEAGRNMAGETIRSYFQADHGRLDRLFDEFQTLKACDIDSARERFENFKRGLERHMGWEEEILFPLFEEKTGMKSAGPTQVMRSEHEQLRAMLLSLEGKLREEERGESNEGDALAALLAQHNLKEENILYPLIDESITEEERQEIFKKIKISSETGTSGCCGTTNGF